MTLDARGRLIRANRAAESLLARRAGFTVQGGRLRCSHEASERAFAAAVAMAAAAALGRGDAGAAALAVERPPALRPLGVVVAPVFAAEGGTPLLTADLRHRAAVLVTISDPDAGLEICAERVERIFGLTPAEARVAVALAGGASLEEYAARAGITLGSTRWTVKKAMEKTDCRRQSELVRLVATSVAGFGAAPQQPR